MAMKNFSPGERLFAADLNENFAETKKAGNVNEGEFSVDRIPNIPASKTTSGTFNVDRIPTLPGSKIANGFLYAGTRVYTGNGTFSKSDPLGTGDIGLRAIRVLVVGGGGGGGGARETGSGQVSVGSGGGGGATGVKFYSGGSFAALSTITDVFVGGGGNGGFRGPGTTGGGTRFGAQNDSRRVDCAGGQPGDATSVGSSDGRRGGKGSNAAFNADYVISGGGGGAAQHYSSAGAEVAIGGHGGSSFMGGGPEGTANSNGETPQFWARGAGGSGAANPRNNLGGQTGGAGNGGIVIIDCFV